MLLYIAVASAGACLGALAIGLLAAKRVSEAEDYAEEVAGSHNELALLRARIRAIQENGKPFGKDVTYNIQKPDGRFGKFTLPRV